MSFRRRVVRLAVLVVAVRLFLPWFCGREADDWYRGDPGVQRALADRSLAFEARDDEPTADRFAGEWALVTHQMIALGLAQLCLAHPDWSARYAPAVTAAALKTMRPEMRDFGTRAWNEDALAALDGPHGHAYLAYSALAIGMARLVDPAFPRAHVATHDRLIAAYERRLLASPTGLIETYPGEAYPTDVAAVAAAIAVHGRISERRHTAALSHWAERVRAVQLDRASGLLHQRMGGEHGEPHDAPRGSGTGLAAYFAGFADRGVARDLANGLLRHESAFCGFGAVREYADGHGGWGDVDSGPVILGVSVAATGFSLAVARAHGRRDSFERIYRTTALFGVPFRGRFLTGGAIGNALMLALLTSGPELAP